MITEKVETIVACAWALYLFVVCMALIHADTILDFITKIRKRQKQ